MSQAKLLTAVLVVALGLSASPAAGGADEPRLYALYAWVADYLTYREDILNTGVRWVRAGGWLRSPEQTDRAVLQAAADGVRLVPVLSVPGAGHGRTMSVEAMTAAFRRIVRENVARYGTGGSLWKSHPEVKPLPIGFWEIWNEPNIEFLTPPEGVERPQLYARLLTAASEEIRRADSLAKIVAFNTAGGVPLVGRGLDPDGMYEKLRYVGWRKFIRDGAAAAGRRSFDIVGVHPYTQPKGPEAGDIVGGLKMLREAAEVGRFADKPVWFTEVGFPVVYPRGRQVRDERQQACFLVRLLAVAAAHGVEQVQVMYVTDIVYGPDQSKRAFGLFTAPGRRREQATAMEVMIDLLPDPRRSATILQESASGVWAYRFRGARGIDVVMAWTAGPRPRAWSVEVVGADQTGVDMLGRPLPLAVKDGKVSLTLTEAPVYVVGADVEITGKILGK